MTRLDDMFPPPAMTAHTFVQDKGNTCMCGNERFTGWHVAAPEPRTWDDEAWWNQSTTGEQLEAAEFPPLVWLVDGLIRQGSLTILAGPPKSFKSLLALSCSLAVASGGVALGRSKAIQGRVMFLSLDDASLARQQRRIRDHLAPGEVIPPLFTLHTTSIGEGREAVKALDRYLLLHDDVRLLVIDTLEHLRAERTRGESQYRADVRAMGNFRWLLQRHPDVTILVLLHTRKGDDSDLISAVGGTHGVTGGADAALRLRGQRGSPRRVLEMVGRDDDDKEMVVEATNHGLMIVDDDPTDAFTLLGNDDRQLCRVISDFGDGATLKDLQTAMPGARNLEGRLFSLVRNEVVRRRGKTYYI